MTSRVPRSTSRGPERFDAIVVGSGFGGSVCAARLAERGFDVLLLERGPFWGPLQRSRPAEVRREFPRGAWGARKLLRNLRLARGGTRSEWLFQKDGLLEVHAFEHMNTLTASAVGGGSHVYTGILEQPPEAFFQAYPPEITGFELAPYFERVRQVMRPAPIPTLPPKGHAFARAVASAGLPSVQTPDLAIVWSQDGDGPKPVHNAAGVEQFTSTGQGDAVVGCTDGSKTTLDLTYLPLALKNGAKLQPLCEVLAIGSTKGGYWVRYLDHLRQTETCQSAPRLILAAGSLNTQRLLFRARDAHGDLPELPATLGQRFSPNGDSLTLVYDSPALEDCSVGSSVSSICRIGEQRGRPFIVGELGLPLHGFRLPAWLRRKLQRSTFLFGMGRDASSGTLSFDGQGLTTALGRSFDRELYDEMQQTAVHVARYYRGRHVFRDFLAGSGPEGLCTVHPLGGCAIGRSKQDGFTDHRGEVFGHPGLFVADGSLYPGSPGVPPSMTIAALAERQAELIE